MSSFIHDIKRFESCEFLKGAALLAYLSLLQTASSSWSLRVVHQNTSNIASRFTTVDLHLSGSQKQKRLKFNGSLKSSATTAMATASQNRNTSLLKHIKSPYTWKRDLKFKCTTIHPDGAEFVFLSELHVPGRCSCRAPAPGKRLLQATQAVKDIWKFQLIKQSSAPPHPDSEPVAVFDVVPLVN